MHPAAIFERPDPRPRRIVGRQRDRGRGDLKTGWTRLRRGHGRACGGKHGEEERREIGSTSCRERGCQYVSISVAAVPSKIKTITDTKTSQNILHMLKNQHNKH